MLKRVFKIVRKSMLPSLGILLFFSGSALANSRITTSSSEILINFSFPKPHFIQTQSGASMVTIEGLANSLDPTAPTVPFQTYRLALPQGARVRDVHFEPFGVDEYRASLAFSAPMRAISPLPPEKFIRVEKWTETQPDSSQRFAYSIQQLHGTSIAVLNFYPVENNRESNIIKVVRSGQLKVSFETQLDATGHGFARYPHQLNELRNFVDNPAAISDSNVSADLSATYDYLIIASGALIGFRGENDLTAFVSNLESRGLKARIVDASQLLAGTSGIDKASKVRNFIRSEYQKNGIRYALLVGDDDTRGGSSTIPVRKLWGNIRGFDGDTWKELREDISADLYYGCLDGDFDGNSNSVWGETNDGEGGGDVDLLCEVAVGRVTAEKPEELANFVRKTTFAASQKLPRTTLLLGEELFAEKGIYGSEYMSQLVGRVVDHGYETNGLSTAWSIDRLYDTASKAWRGADVKNALNSSKYLFVNHLGHSNEFYNMRILGADVEQITNTLPFFLYTQGCQSSRFTTNDSIHELMLRSPNSAFAIIGNTTYGLVPEDPSPSQTKTPGASQMLHRGFVDLLSGNPDIALGRAHQLSKQRFIGYAAIPEMRWVFWAANYFGDPALVLHF